MKPKSKKLKAPPTKRRNPDHDAYYINRISEIGLNARKVQKSKKRFMKDLKISEFQLNNIFFRSVLRKKNFGEATTSVEMAISKILESTKPIFVSATGDFLTIHNQNKSLVIFMFKEKEMVWASTERLSTVGYFQLEKLEYKTLFDKWKREAIDTAFETTVLKEDL